MVSFNQQLRPNRQNTRQSLACLGFVFGLILTLLSGCSSTVKSSASGQNPHDIKPIVKPPTVIAADPSWFACKTDGDCQVREGVCGEEQALNKLYTTQFFSYRDQMSRTVDCINKAVDSTQHTAQCVKQRCSLNPPDHQP
jgi:hypothetical protein